MSVLALVRPQRVLAVITGSDGKLMGSFRNFVAWLAVHNRPSREQLGSERSSKWKPESFAAERSSGSLY